MTAVQQLPAQDLAMLRFAGEWWRDGSARDQAIVERFGIPPVRFHQRIAYLVLQEPAAQAAEPVIVARLRRVVDRRRAGRRHMVGGAR